MLIIGSGGLAKQNIDLLQERGLLDKAVFFNNVEPESNALFMARFPVLRTQELAKEYLRSKDPHFVVMVGGPAHRQRLQAEFTAMGGQPQTLISPKADIGAFDVAIGKGTIVMARALIESTVTLGNGVLINVGAIVTHDTVIGDFCEIGPGAKLCGKVSLGEEVFIGAGAIVLPGVSVGAGAIIGAGAVVVRSVAPGEKVAGSPAKPIS